MTDSEPTHPASYGALTYAYVSESELADALESLRLTMPGLNYLQTAEKILYEITGTETILP
jgi:hypothetical protein